MPSLGPPVRVQVFPDQAGELTLVAGGRVRILTLPDLVLRYDGDLPRPARVAAEKEGFRIAGQFYPSPVRLDAASGGGLSVKPSASEPGAAGQARAYRGSLDLFNLQGRLRAINEVSMEEYLAGVVGEEMPAHFPAAALAGQAIASRTYAMYHLGASPARALSEGFQATPLFQVYNGLTREHPAARRAVKETAGWVLTYQGRLFPAYYQSTCGGSTASAASVFGLRDIPPLRGVSCGGCERSPFHRWTVSLPLRRIEDCLRPWAEAQRMSLGEVLRIEGVEPLGGGYLRYVRVVHAGGQFEMRADRFRDKLIRGGIASVRSTSFTARPGSTPGTVELRGAGWGHGVGMCQHGAATRGRAATHGEVLAHYFPESELKKVY